MALSVVFVVAVVICIVALVFGIRAKRVNIGYIITTSLLIICDGLSIFLLENNSIRGARNILFAYYLAYSWMFFGTTWTVVQMASVKKPRASLILMGILCSFQTFLVVYCFNTPQVIFFNKNILFGRLWWGVEQGGEAHGFLTFKTYMDFCVIICLIIIVITLICLLRVQKMFRSKFALLISLQFGLLAMVVLTHFFHLPVWIYTLLMNPVCYFVYYYAYIQNDRKIRAQSLMSFANDMSDGFILYNEYNDLIHVNDLIKNTMDEEFLEGLKDIKFFEEWRSHVEQVENIKTRTYKKGDKELYFIVKKHDIGTDKDMVGTAYVLHDTTNSINQIRLMEQVNYELERTAKMKSDFLANMSHELRTPMNAVIGMAEIALREGEMSPRIKDCLLQINSSGRNLLNIINDILDYSKIDAGKMDIIPEKYEPLSEVNDISNILQTRIGDKNVELFFIVDPSLPHELYGDNMRIRQVIINIANNAIKFTERGRVRITLDCERKGDDEIELIYHIVDTGQGIKEEDLKKLFESFQQVDSKRNRNIEGTGLGLAISKRLVEAMGGTIGVNSEYGKGSDFWFRIPQKITVDRPDLVVTDAENKFAYGYNERQIMVDEFYKEMSVLGLESRLISRFEDYVPTGKKDFIFIEENFYTRGTEKFLDDNPNLTAVVLTRFGSGFKPTRRNVRILSRPMTTLAMVLTLNGKDISSMNFNSSVGDLSTNFTAPDARILIVDDNSINLSIAVGLIEPMKIMCEVAQSGQEAIEKIKNLKFDIIFMDHMMPGMDGIETTKMIKETIPSAKDIPIIALTANVVEGSKEEFINAGMVDMVAKPIEVKQLNQKLYTWLPKEKICQAEKIEIGEQEAVAEVNYDIFDCLDCRKAITSLGSEGLFKKIVSEYYRRGKGTASEIEKAFARKDWPDYAIKTHALKSSSRQIGALSLGELAEKLEHAGKAEDVETIVTVHPRAMDELNSLLCNLAKYFPENEESGELPPITEGELKIIFADLEEACNNLEMDAMEDCAKRLKKFVHPEDKKEKLEKLYEAIDNVDTEGCLDIIREY